MAGAAAAAAGAAFLPKEKGDALAAGAAGAFLTALVAAGAGAAFFLPRAKVSDGDVKAEADATQRAKTGANFMVVTR